MCYRECACDQGPDGRCGIIEATVSLVLPCRMFRLPRQSHSEALGPHVESKPMNVAGLGGECLVLPAKDFPKYGDFLGGSGIRASLYSVCESPVI